MTGVTAATPELSYGSACLEVDGGSMTASRASHLRVVTLLLLGATVLTLDACTVLRSPRSLVTRDATSGPPTELLSRQENLDAVLRQHAPRLAAPDRAGVVAALLDAERVHGLDPLLVLALMAQESTFRPTAVGPFGSIGLMQVLPSTGREVARKLGIPWKGNATLFHPATNVRIGTHYLAGLHAKYGKLPLTLAAYNVGPGRVDEILSSGRQPLNRYSGGIMRHHVALERSSRLLLASNRKL